MLKKWLPLFLFLFPVALSFFFVFHFAVDVPWGDQMDIVPPLLEKHLEGRLTFSDLTAVHNEHLIFFPRVIMLALAQLTRWDTRAEMMVIQLLLVWVLWILARAMKLSGHIGIWWLVPLPWLVFNLKQWETMLFGVQIAYLLPVAASLAALSCLAKMEKARRPWLQFIFALAAACVASFSLMAGLLVWFAGAAVLLLGGHDDPRARRLFLPVWVAFGIAGWLIYAVKISTATAIGHFTLDHTPALARFMLALLGNAVIARQTLAPLAGGGIAALLLLTAVLLTRSRLWRRNRFWVGVLLFTSAVLASITLGRSGAGPEAAFAPRYTTFSLILLAALYALLANLVRENPSPLPRFALTGLLIVIVLSLPIALHRGWYFGGQQHEKQKKQALVLRNAQALPDDQLTIVHPVPRVVRRGALILQRLQWSVFRAPTDRRQQETTGDNGRQKKD